MRVVAAISPLCTSPLPSTAACLPCPARLQVFRMYLQQKRQYFLFEYVLNQRARQLRRVQEQQEAQAQ